MNEKPISSNCERADDLVSVLYGEVSERETRDFELHLKQCAGCRAEFAAFGQVRESIGEWRDEALTGFVPSHSAMPVPVVKKSALGALLRFFDLSPLWLKGAVGFAAVVFCVLAASAVFRPRPEVSQVATVRPNAVYTQADVDRAVQQALAKQEEQRLVTPKPMVVESAPNKSTVAKRGRRPEAQRPFSRAEREQLAADLRLLSGDDDLNLELPGDQNNPR
ncbi:MAG: zf-HC2 domain-containing protein [Acidobacteria bacterium]|nr:zf-HC2 domain-containing protein [Acidobacteriota bacterium]